MISLIISCSILLIIATLDILFVLSFFTFGAWYAPTTAKKLQAMIDLAEITEDQKILDLGSGDGRIMLAAAKRGAHATGIEINPLLVYITKFKIHRQKLQHKAVVKRANFWKEDFKDYDVVFLFQVGYIMEKLEKKLLAELKPGAKIVTNHFKLPSLKPVKSRDEIHVYVR